MQFTWIQQTGNSWYVVIHSSIVDFTSTRNKNSMQPCWNILVKLHTSYLYNKAIQFQLFQNISKVSACKKGKNDNIQMLGNWDISVYNFHNPNAEKKILGFRGLQMLISVAAFAWRWLHVYTPAQMQIDLGQWKTAHVDRFYLPCVTHVKQAVVFKDKCLIYVNDSIFFESFVLFLFFIIHLFFPFLFYFFFTLHWPLVIDSKELFIKSQLGFKYFSWWKIWIGFLSIPFTLCSNVITGDWFIY